MRHLLILISRILLIVFLVMAFARPYFPGRQGMERSETTTISIYVDNSMSMQASSNGHRLLDEALSKAAEIADAYGPSDRFHLLTNDFEGKHQLFYNRDDFHKLLSEVSTSPVWRSSSEVNERYSELLNAASEDKPHLYIVSDFQRSSTDLQAYTGDTSRLLFLVPLIDESLANVYIDSCSLVSPFNHLGAQQEIVVGLTNATDFDLEKIPVRLLINDQQRAIATFDIMENSRAEVRLPFTNREAGMQRAEIIIDDYPITWDDRMYLSWVVKNRIPVLVISENEPGFYFSKLFSNDSVFQYTFNDIRKLDYGGFPDKDLIILDNVKNITSGLSTELERYVSSGGSIMLIPSSDADLVSMNLFLSKLNNWQLQGYDTNQLSVTGLNVEHELFADVFESIPENLDLPIVRGHYPIKNYISSRGDVIMDMQNSDPLICVSTSGKGKVYLMSSPAGDAYSNLVRHALWVPLIYRMAMLSRPLEHLYYTMGEDNSILVHDIVLAGDQSLIVKREGDDYEFIPGFVSDGKSGQLQFYDRIVDAGQYTLWMSDQAILGFAFNFNRNESDPEIYSPDEIEDFVASSAKSGVFLINNGQKSIQESVTEFNNGTELWKVFIFLALLFALIEILLLRLFRK